MTTDTDPSRHQYRQRQDDCREWEPVPATVPLTGTVHELKCWPDVFQAMWDGLKTFEYRKDDRGYKVGDVIRNREHSASSGEYTGRELRLLITYKLSEGHFGVPTGYCVLSVRPAPGPAQTELTPELLERNIARREAEGAVFATEEDLKTLFPPPVPKQRNADDMGLPP